MDENNTPPSGEWSPGSSTDTVQPSPIISDEVLAYRPVVAAPPDLHLDLDLGVIVGRSESLHRQYGSTGLGLIGAVCESSDDVLTSLLGMPVRLDLISPHVMLVAGKRGSGKSYTLGIIAEELALAMERLEIEVAVIIIDTVDVFRQMVEPDAKNDELLSKWGLKSRGFPATVYIPQRVYDTIPEDIRQREHLAPLVISPAQLSASDWSYVLEREGRLSTAQSNMLRDVLEYLNKPHTKDDHVTPVQPDFSIDDMIQCITQHPLIQEMYKPTTQMALIHRLKNAQKLGIFAPHGTSAHALAVAGRITIIDMAPLGSDAEIVLAILTNIIARQVLSYRMSWRRDGENTVEELPPTWLIVDEAHTLVPDADNTPAKTALIGYAKMGRKFGCSLVLCTQQPSAVANEAISQADIVISHALVHEGDIRALQQRAPKIMPDQFRDKAFISGLPAGVALLFDQSTENRRSFLIQARPRLSRHGGSDRLSVLFEASQMLELQPVHDTVGPSQDTEDEQLTSETMEQPVARPSDEYTTDTTGVPRPPINLSIEDWRTLDSWIREYVQATFDRLRQDFVLTSEAHPATRREPAHSDIQSSSQSETTATDMPSNTQPLLTDFDCSTVVPKQFVHVTPTLLSKALSRLIMYSPRTHEFLFRTADIHKVVIGVTQQHNTASALLEQVVAQLGSAGLRVTEMVRDRDVPFLFLTGERHTQAVLSVGVSDETVCVVVVITGHDRRLINSIADRLRKINGESY